MKRDMSLASFLAMHRMKQGLSQRQLSERMGYTTPQFVSNWENSTSLPPMNKSSIEQLSSAIQVKPRELVDRITEEKIYKIRKDVERFLNENFRK